MSLDLAFVQGLHFLFPSDTKVFFPFLAPSRPPPHPLPSRRWGVGALCWLLAACHSGSVAAPGSGLPGLRVIGSRQMEDDINRTRSISLALDFREQWLCETKYTSSQKWIRKNSSLRTFSAGCQGVARDCWRNGFHSHRPSCCPRPRAKHGKCVSGLLPETRGSPAACRCPRSTNKHLVLASWKSDDLGNNNGWHPAVTVYQSPFKYFTWSLTA